MAMCHQIFLQMKKKLQFQLSHDFSFNRKVIPADESNTCKLLENSLRLTN